MFTNINKKGIKKISEELEVPKTCLMKQTKQIDFISQTISDGKKYRLERIGRNPSTLNIEDDLLKWAGNNVCQKLLFLLMKLLPNYQKLTLKKTTLFILLTFAATASQKEIHME